MVNKELWDRCVAFHGHECPGLTIGFRAALYARDLICGDFSEDENIVCIAENDACGIDAIQVLLGCSAGKGNLIFHMTGKSAYSFYNRDANKAIRIIMNPNLTEGLSREERMVKLHEIPQEEMFKIMEPKLEVPEKARIFESHICDCCKEETGAKWIKEVAGQKLCLDCCK